MNIEFFKGTGMTNVKVEYIARCFSVKPSLLKTMELLDVTTEPYLVGDEVFIGCDHFIGFKCQVHKEHLTIYETIELLRKDLACLNRLLGGHLTLEELCLLYPHRRLLGERYLYLN